MEYRAKDLIREVSSLSDRGQVNVPRTLDDAMGDVEDCCTSRPSVHVRLQFRIVYVYHCNISFTGMEKMELFDLLDLLARSSGNSSKSRSI